MLRVAVKPPLAILFVVLVGGRVGAADDGGMLRLATCQFPVSADVTANGHWVRTQMRQASDRGADLIHFPECALSGYAGVDLPSIDEMDWEALHEETEAVLALARVLEVWVVLGSTHRLSGENRPHNCLYVISPEGRIIDRYDKRFCTGGDLEHYSPGDHFVTFEVKGVRCGLLICYDIRFPELYREYHKLGVRLMLHSFYNARQKEGSIHPRIMPTTARAYAGVNNMFVSINNSSAPRSWPSRFITPDGLVRAKLPTDEPGVMVNLVDLHEPYYDASAPFRPDALRGKLNSGEVVDDPRSRDRTGY
jgi:predicted amidohydrolase